VGVVSLFDLVSYLAGFERPQEEPGGFYRYSYPKFSEDGEGWDSEWEAVEEVALKEITVGEIMATEIITVPPKLALVDVGKLLAERHIHRVFVAGENGPVGVISTMDLLRAMTGAAPPKVHAKGESYASPA
jgi:CBS domain containing-hemolysin-like protein